MTIFTIEQIQVPLSLQKGSGLFDTRCLHLHYPLSPRAFLYNGNRNQSFSTSASSTSTSYGEREHSKGGDSGLPTGLASPELSNCTGFNGVPPICGNFESSFPTVIGSFLRSIISKSVAFATATESGFMGLSFFSSSHYFGTSGLLSGFFSPLLAATASFVVSNRANPA